MYDLKSDLFDPSHGNDASRQHWHAARETMPADGMRELQLAKLKRQLIYLAENSELYKRRFRALGFQPGDLKTIEDLSRLPFTTKSDLRQSQDEMRPLGLHQAAPMDRIVRFTATSGTSGRPVIQGYTAHDVAQRSESLCRAMWGFGIRPGDRVVNAFALSMFSAGIPLSAGVEQLGAVNVPAGAERRAEGVLKVIQDTCATVLAATPSFLLYLAEKAPDVLGKSADNLGLRIVFGGGESGLENPTFRAGMEQLWGTPRVYDWASASDAHPNLFTHCTLRDGKHHMTPDLVLVELIDPATGAMKDVVDGAEGEYIFTHLDREACPLMRYRTGDILRVNTKPCVCGRTGFRMDIIGRSDDMLIVRGINVFPTAIRATVGHFVPRLSGQTQVVLRAPGPKADSPLEVRIECAEGVDPADAGDLRAAIEKHVRSELSITIRALLVPFGQFERTTTKTKLVVVEPPETAGSRAW